MRWNLPVIVLLFLLSLGLNAQTHFPIYNPSAKYSSVEDTDGTEKLSLQWNTTLSAVKEQVHASDKDFAAFLNFYQPHIDSARLDLYTKTHAGTTNPSTVKNYMNSQQQNLVALYTNFSNQYNNIQMPKVAPSYTAPTCDSACTNMDFSNANLDGWYGYYATNTASTSAYSITGVNGGALGAVVKGAYDGNTKTYQIHLTSNSSVDWFLKNYHKILMSQASPWGNGYSVMIGDSVKTSTPYSGQVAILSQDFNVTPTTNSITYAYSVLLENPTHSYYQQPFFSVTVFDQNGDTIKNCGQYSVYSGPGLAGFKGEYYSVGKDTVYWRNWTQVNVPLTSYVGECVTIQFEVSDCELGGHFGYAYVDAACSKFAISANSPDGVICGKNGVITLNGPAGEKAYAWSGPKGGIVGSDTLADVKVDSFGTYKLIITPVTGSLCKDTLSYVVKNRDTISTTASIVSNIACYGGTGTVKATAINGWGPYTYAWGPGGQTSATVSGLPAGADTVTVTDTNACAATAVVILTQPAQLIATIKNTPATCGNNNGTATALVSGGVTQYAYYWNPSGQTTAKATGLSVGSYTVTVTDKNSCTVTSQVKITQPAVVTATMGSITPVNCFGENNGAATVTPGGGASPYTYSWAPSGGNAATATGLTAGGYTVTVSDTNGCTATASATITQPTLLTATISATNNILCNGGVGSAAVTAAGGTSSYNYLWAPSGGTSATGTGLTAGSYTVTVQDAHGCSATASTIITQPNILTVNAFTTANVACNGQSNGSAGQTTTGGTGPYAYTWTPAAGTMDTATGLSAGTYTLAIVDQHGCTASMSTVVTQPATLNVSAIVTSNLVCRGGNTGATSSTASGGTGPYTYLWTPTGGTNSNATGLMAGTYSITVTDNHGCTALATITVTQPPALAVTVGVTSNVACNGGNGGAVSATASAGTSPYTYLWSPNGGSANTATGLTAGIYTITVTDNCGASTSAAVTVTQPTILTVPAYTLAHVSCNGSKNGIAIDSAVGGTGPYTYLWAPGGATTQKVTNLAAGTYSVGVADLHGCTATASVIITQPVALATTVSSTRAFCNQPTGSASVSVTGGTAPYTYAWNPSGQKVATATSLSIGTYSVVVTDNHNCSTSASVTVTQPPPVLATITGVTNISCYSNGNDSLKATATGGLAPYTYLWSPGGQTNATVTGLIVATYTVKVTDIDGCSTSNTISVVSTPVMNISIDEEPKTICKDSTGNLLAYLTGGTPPYKYVWSQGSTTSDITIKPASVSNYSVTVADINGCTATSQIALQFGPPVSVGISGKTVICWGDSTTLCADVIGGTGGNTYLWGPNTNTNSCVKLAPTLSLLYSVTVADYCGATATAGVTVYATPPPVINFNSNFTQGCAPFCVQFHNEVTIVRGKILQYVWLFGNGDTVMSPDPIYCYSTNGKYSVTLTAISDSGCSATLTRVNMISIYSRPNAAFTSSPQPASILSPTVQFNDKSTDPNGGIAYWWWSFGDASDSASNIQNPVHTYSDTGTFCANLMVMDNYGCTDTTTDCVIIGPAYSLYIPSAFTPNGDGLNEVFKPVGQYIKYFDMYIFDRWGMEIYHTNNINNGWNGAVHGVGAICQEDTYIYKITVTDAANMQHSYIGNVNLLK